MACTVESLSKEFCQHNGVLIRRPLVKYAVHAVVAFLPPRGCRFAEQWRDRWAREAKARIQSQFNPLFALLIAQLIVAVIEWLLDTYLQNSDLSFSIERLSADEFDKVLGDLAKQPIRPRRKR
jgi:hypothetical protein